MRVYAPVFKFPVPSSSWKSAVLDEVRGRVRNSFFFFFSIGSDEPKEEEGHYLLYIGAEKSISERETGFLFGTYNIQDTGCLSERLSHFQQRYNNLRIFARMECAIQTTSTCFLTSERLRRMSSIL